MFCRFDTHTPKCLPDMSRMGAWGLFVLFVLSDVACGPARQQVLKRNEIDALPDWSPDPPLLLGADDAACQDSVGDVVFTQAQVSRWLGPTVVTAPVDFTGVRSAPDLKTDGVSGTTWGARYRRVCDAKQLGCVDSTGGQSSGFTLRGGSERPLRVCRDDYAYPRGSVESAAIATIYSIKSARAAALEAIPGAILAPLRLMVQPVFESVQTGVAGADGQPKNLHSYITNNLAYFAVDGSDAAAMAVFPESQNWKSLSDGHLWESYFVVAHEYGHHIHRAVAPGLADAVGVRWSDLFLPDRNEDASFEMRGGPSISLARLAAAISESFADLSAFYGEGGSAISLVGIPCLGVSRDPRRGSFGGGRAKIVDQPALDAFFGDATGGPSSCESPDLHEIHAFGSVLAYQLDRVFEKAVRWRLGESAAASATIMPRYRLAVDFVRRLEGRIRESQSGIDNPLELMEIITDSVSRVLDAHITSALADNPGLSATDCRTSVCQVVRAGFPAVSPLSWCQP